MSSMRKVSLALAAMFAVVLVVPALADGASDFIANTAKAQSTLDQMSKLIDDIHNHSGTAMAAPGGGGQQVAATDDTMKCPVCGMMMTAKATAANAKKVTIKGKTYYCCAGCDMSKVADKPAPRRNGQRRPTGTTKP